MIHVANGLSPTRNKYIQNFPSTLKSPFSSKIAKWQLRKLVIDRDSQKYLASDSQRQVEIGRYLMDTRGIVKGYPKPQGFQGFNFYKGYPQKFLFELKNLHKQLQNSEQKISKFILFITFIIFLDSPIIYFPDASYYCNNVINYF